MAFGTPEYGDDDPVDYDADRRDRELRQLEALKPPRAECPILCTCRVCYGIDDPAVAS